ncbi:MAG: bifunctional ornithine acetyltransferase/N-acetylglutamate synthase [Verrucomicrobiales bacterium]|nr:bifunctional ornithine acetyltransferase/N-acetylglutamate synthase [Verrucomicrobiales bacterium]|tara:strand:- start:10436 stop:11773 length:1338 start_codon:yes stop_codon:yes gene_type:complete
MKTPFKSIVGSINAPKGFSSSGVFCDVKKIGTGKGSDKGQKRDLALIVSERAATVAGMFTTNQVCAAPVKVCVENIRNGKAQAVVVNSGNANACTGKQGTKDAWQMARVTAKTLGLDEGDVLVGSTGRIGWPLPMANIKQGIADAAGQLKTTAKCADHAAEAIMTSDTKRKQIAVEFKLGGKAVRIGGIAKGAGMIQPGMSPTGARPASMPLHATMLGYITTDADIAAKPVQAALREAVAASFNCVTVDGDMSTNDTVLVLANGLAGNKRITASGFKNNPDFLKFAYVLWQVCLELSKMMVRDGEGVHRVVKVNVTGANTLKDADLAARSVANSALVKTSWHGGDPNWGRIIDALGYSEAKVVEEKVDIGYSKPDSRKIVWSLKKGQPSKTSFATLCKAVEPKEFELHINLNLGSGGRFIYAADLTEDYVDFNKGDISDPAALGG